MAKMGWRTPFLNKLQFTYLVILCGSAAVSGEKARLGRSYSVHANNNTNSFWFVYFNILLIWSFQLLASIYIKDYSWDIPFIAWSCSKPINFITVWWQLSSFRKAVGCSKSVLLNVSCISNLGWFFSMPQKERLAVRWNSPKWFGNPTCAHGVHLLSGVGDLAGAPVSPAAIKSVLFWTW